MSIDEQRRLYTVVTLVEPEDAQRVQYRPDLTAADTLPLPAWKEGLAFTTDPMLFQSILQSYPLLLNGKEKEAQAMLRTFGVKLEQVQPAWDFLRRHNTPKDHELTLWVLGHHGDPQHRVLACALLMNFTDADSTWWQLVDALRDGNELVRSMASSVQRALTRHRAREVDWRPVLASLRPVLRGTNVSAYLDTLEMLRVTKVAPELNRDLLAGADDLLIAFLKAEHAPSRQRVNDFLQYVSGQGKRSPEEWQHWLAQLQAKS